jgi:hypothetical protein
MAAASASANGYLTSADWSTFNSKGFGSVTSVAATVPSFLSVAGTPITSSGTLAITYSGVALPIANGGTNATTANSGFNNLAPSQTANSGKFLTTDGTNTSWATVAASPAGSNTQVQFNNSGAFGAAATFTWNGTSLSVPALEATTSATTPLLQSSASNLTLTASTGIVDASTNTGAFVMPKGTTAQRPASPVLGQIRMNTTTGYPEWYDTSTSSWFQFNQSKIYSVTYLVVAGGGGGSGWPNGGGAGGLLTSTVSFTPLTIYTITVGAGGTAPAGASGTTGNNSVISGIATAFGGGYGVFSNGTGGSGGSGGGGGTPGAGTSGQGFAGGTQSVAGFYGGGAGGGASAVGGNGSTTNGGAGGAGLASSITGSSVTYAGGGGGGTFTAGTAGAGGAGGGGNGSATTAAATAGGANTGGGGGGGFQDNMGTTYGGGAGGSGVVILSIPTANYTGTTTGSPTVTTSGSFTILKYTASGTYTA